MRPRLSGRESLTQNLSDYPLVLVLSKAGPVRVYEPDSSHRFRPMQLEPPALQCYACLPLFLMYVF